MKKYIAPAVDCENVIAAQILALSTMTGDADKNGEVLVEEQNAWDDMWEE